MPREGVSGRRLLLALGLWAGQVAVVCGGTLLGTRVLARAWAVGHRADVGALLITEAYVTLLVALLLSFGGPAGVRDQLRFRFTSLADLAVALALWLAALLVGGAVTAMLSPLLGQPESNTVSLLRQSFDPLFVALIVPTVCVLAPACEELLFRGALFGWLIGRLPVGAAVVVTAAIFAGAHLLPTLLPVLFVFGLAATLVRARTGSTLNSFAMHATQNTVAVFATYAALSQGSV
ncbi:MAG TPA: CPBP family intramembrane glutamic endopeptidase [Candidatus Eisenbacteria bacterium]|nr:CPBP family intramembrane glutamic endopeptidase [Candidatus Eisenbacteria bacterium]